MALAEVRALFISLLILVGNLVPLAQFPASVEATVVSAATPTLVAVTGETLNGAVVGQKVTLKVRLNGSYAQGYVAILEVREKSGVTLDILTREGNVLAASPADIDFPWSAPYSGVFDVRTFVISLDESPDVLSGVASSTITIADSMAELAALEPDPVVEPSSTEIPESAAESEPAAYTFMVYMVASDLESTGYHATQDILEMMSVGSTKNVNVIIQTGGSANSTINDFRFIDFTKVQRHQVMNDEIKLIQDLGKRNMASASTLGDFVSWGLSRYPAEKYVIILWDHGAGMIGFGYDDIYDDILDLGELHEGLAPIVHQGKQFEIIGFDACLMASVEVANAITGRGKYLVASEELEPAWGLDFGAILESIDANPKQDGKALGIVIADSYLAHARKQGSEYENYSADRALTMSVIDLEKIPAMYREAGQIGDYLDRLGGDFEITHTLTKTIRETERYGESGKSSTGHLDLYHLAENLDREFPGPVNLGQKLKTMIDEAVVYNVGGDARQDSHGISIFMQVEEYEANAPYLKYIVGKWISVLTSTRQSLARDYSPPDISLSVRKDNTLFGKIEGIDLDYVSTFVTQDVEDNRFRLKILSIVDEEAEDFVKPNDLGFMSYNWSRQIMSLCNGGEQDCKPTSMTFEKNGRTKFAYTQARLESDRYNGTLWLIYIASDNNSRFEFLGGWPGVDDNGNAIRELVPLVEGDHVYALSYLIRYDPTADESFFEQIEDPDPITIAEGFGPAGHIYPGEYNLIISACDFSDNCGYSDYFPYTVE